MADACQQTCRATCARNLSQDPSRLLSLFDSLGPVMTGPSSSHTAGMARIGRMGHCLAGGTPEKITLSFYGALSQTYKGHASDSAVVAGLLGETEASPRIREALAMAEERSIPVECVTFPDSGRNPNTVTMDLIRNGRTFRIEGISVGGGEIEMITVDGFPVTLRGNESGVLLLSGDEISLQAIETAAGVSFSSCSTKNADGTWGALCLGNASPSEEILDRLSHLPGVSAVYPVRKILDSSLEDATPLFSDFAALAGLAEQEGTLVGAIERYEMKRSGVSRHWVRQKTLEAWEVMRRSIAEGLSGDTPMLAGLVKGNSGKKLVARVASGASFSGSLQGKAIAEALAVMEANAAMRCVVASPTAGACGILAGVVSSLAEARSLESEQIIDCLLVAAATGVLIAMRAPVSGALGGCQSEIGVASAMAAAALVQIDGGSAEQMNQAVAISLKNVLGLICDPVGGPVEIPCIKRNAMGVANAFAAADMALCGIESRIPADEVVSALINVQKLLHPDLRGNLKGGLASTPTGIALKKEWQDKLQGMQKT